MSVALRERGGYDLTDRETLTDLEFCRRCLSTVAWTDPDACLGLLPGVSHACCGHGGLSEPYVVIGGEPNQDAFTIPDKVVLDGMDALDWFDAHGVGPGVQL